MAGLRLGCGETMAEESQEPLATGANTGFFLRKIPILTPFLHFTALKHSAAFFFFYMKFSEMKHFNPISSKERLLFWLSSPPQHIENV